MGQIHQFLELFKNMTEDFYSFVNLNHLWQLQ